MLVASPTNCNVFVGGLGHGVTSEILHAAFETFSLNEEEKQQMKTHVVMDVARNRSKGYGFVSFPCRRSAELAMICMQDFEIYERAMQLGWGQENREEQLEITEELQQTKTDQQQREKETPMRTLPKPKGDIVSDTVYSDQVDLVTKQPLKRRSSRWDQEIPKKCRRIDESVEFVHSQGDPDQKNREDSLLSEVQHPVVLLNSHFKDSATVLAERSISNQLVNDERDKIKAKIVHEKEIDCTPAVEARKQHSNKIDETGVESVSQENTVDIKGTHFDKEGFSSSSEVEQDPNRTVTEIEKEDERGRSLPDEQKIFCGRARYSSRSSSSEQNSKRAIQWLTHDQKVALIKSVCLKLRAFGVRGHLGVFGVYYEADNSRLYVVCAKHVTEAELLDEFKAFGTVDVKLNKDVNGFSKGCAFAQYADSTCAEQAVKKLHRKVLGGMPMKVMVAEPKVRKGSRGKQKVL